MTAINPDTKISVLIKAHPNALEAIVSLSPSFEKLRIPLLRKVMTPRTSIRAACKIGGCTLEDFMKKMQALGFVVEHTNEENMNEEINTTMPEMLRAIDKNNIIDMDVRPIIASGDDPLGQIMKRVSDISVGQALKLINTFEPIPLINLLKKKGYDAHVEHDGDVVLTYFYHSTTSVQVDEPQKFNQKGWEESVQRFKDKLRIVDVRALEMPLPMITILEELESLPADNALFVYHKRIPVYLLPELQDKGFVYAAKEISEGEVHLIIFKE